MKRKFAPIAGRTRNYVVVEVRGHCLCSHTLQSREWYQAFCDKNGYNLVAFLTLNPQINGAVPE